MSRYQVLVIGGGYAGMLAAVRASREKRARVTLVEPASYFTQRIRLHEAAAGGRIDSFSYQQVLAKRGIQWLQGWLTNWDKAAQRATISTAHGEQQLAYDYCVYAVGSRFQQPPFPVGGAPFHVLNSLAKSQHLYQQLMGNQMHNEVLVVGGGLTGIELSTELAARLPHLKVTLACAADSFDHFTRRARQHLWQAFNRLGVEVRTDKVTRVVDNHVYFADGECRQFHHKVWCGGFETNADRPRYELNDQLQLPEYPNHFVAGDAGACRNVDDSTIRMGCVSAMPMGIYAGDAIARQIRGKSLAPFRFAFMMRCISLGREDGLIQFTHYNDEPKQTILTGKTAAFVKEAICKMTFNMIRWEYATGWPLYQWPKPKQSVANNYESTY